ncbi:MAG: LytTR family DNA-binding domain-containing protein [Bacteroidota bacterium]
MNVLIIEDEFHAAQNLEQMLKELDKDLQIVARIDSVTESVNFLKANEVDLIFLDIHLSDGNSFGIFDQIEVNKPIIFTTAFDQYAIKAFKQNSVDYLLKPIDPEELTAALKKVKNWMGSSKTDLRLKHLLESMEKNGKKLDKLAFPTVDGLEFVPINKIIRCESDEGYTDIYLSDQTRVCTTRKLKELEELLEDYPFFRTHRSFLINLDFMRKYQRGDAGGHVIMEDGTKIPVARRKKEAFLERLSQLQ